MAISNYHRLTGAAKEAAEKEMGIVKPVEDKPKEKKK